MSGDGCKMAVTGNVISLSTGTKLPDTGGNFSPSDCFLSLKMDAVQARLNYGFDESSEPPLTLEFIQTSFTVVHFSHGQVGVINPSEGS